MSRLLIAAFASAAAFGLAAANASPITYYANGSDSDGSLGASAAFTVSAGSIAITITNTLNPSDIKSPGQAVSDLSFTLSNAAGTLGTTSASGQLANMDSSGLVTYTSGSPTRWLGQGGGQFSVSGSTILLEAIGGGQPDQMILPFVVDGGKYANINHGVLNFLPYVDGPATFVLDLAGVTADTTITSATFSFGTQPDKYLGGSTTPPPPPPPPVEAPEPSTLALFGGFLIVLFSVRRLRKA